MVNNAQWLALQTQSNRHLLGRATDNLQLVDFGARWC